MHLHLVQFQLLNRQGIRAERYLDAYSAAFPGEAFIPGYGPPRDYDVPNADFAVGGNPALSPFLRGAWKTPEPGEDGWKDTIRRLPGRGDPAGGALGSGRRAAPRRRRGGQSISVRSDRRAGLCLALPYPRP